MSTACITKHIFPVNLAVPDGLEMIYTMKCLIYIMKSFLHLWILVGFHLELLVQPDT